MTRPLSFISPGFFGVGVRFCVVYVFISCILFAQNKINMEGIAYAFWIAEEIELSVQTFSQLHRLHM